MPPLMVFVIASIALLLTPGPAVLYIVTRSIDQGRMAGFASVAGIHIGTMVHVIGAVAGLSALLASSALAFSIVKYLGAAYLIYLGIRKIIEKPVEADEIAVKPERDLSAAFRQGVIVNVLNPKTALFFLAFLPQFVDPAKGSAALQILFLGSVFVILGICSDGMYAALAGTFGAWLRSSRTFLFGQRYFAGSIYIALGAVTAVAGHRK